MFVFLLETLLISEEILVNLKRCYSSKYYAMSLVRKLVFSVGSFLLRWRGLAAACGTSVRKGVVLTKLLAHKHWINGTRLERFPLTADKTAIFKSVLISINMESNDCMEFEICCSLWGKCLTLQHIWSLLQSHSFHQCCSVKNLWQSRNEC